MIKDLVVEPTPFSVENDLLTPTFKCALALCGCRASCTSLQRHACSLAPLLMLSTFADCRVRHELGEGLCRGKMTSRLLSACLAAGTRGHSWQSTTRRPLRPCTRASTPRLAADDRVGSGQLPLLGWLVC